jgi:hypothetical protein
MSRSEYGLALTATSKRSPLFQGPGILCSDMISRRSRPFGPFAEIHLAFGQPRQQLFRRQINKNDFVGQIEDRIGNSFTDWRACDLANRVAATADMLNIERRINVDPCIEQLENVLVPFGMTRARRVRVRELVNHRKSGMPGENRVEIHFREGGAAIFDLETRDDRHSLE